MTDVAIIGAGISGLALALRLQARGIQTVLLEAHATVGGCPGYFREKEFAFDVGATTLVDFGHKGVGGQFLDEVGITGLAAEELSGYRAWLPDRVVNLYKDAELWHFERLEKLGSSPRHVGFWRTLDSIAETFWDASRRGIHLPLKSLGDVTSAIKALGIKNLHLTRYLNLTLEDLLKGFELEKDVALHALLAMLVEDTVHSTPANAPLINSAMGTSIRGAGLLRHEGGMYGFMRVLVARYRELGGKLQLGCRVERIEKDQEVFLVRTRRGSCSAGQVVSTLQIGASLAFAPELLESDLKRYLSRDEHSMGGAVVVFLGVPDSEVEGESFTHHQLLQNYREPLGDGNNMFISVSSADDIQSAPAGFRSVMLSTHTDLARWETLTGEEYCEQKIEIGERLLNFARRVYPNLGSQPRIFEIGTPRTFARFTKRPRGAVGGPRLTLSNSNQRAVSNETSVKGLWLAGDGTWPGLGTVACVLGSRVVADRVEHHHGRSCFRN